MGDVVGDAHGEVVLGRHAVHVVEHGLDHGGGELLGSQTVPAVDDGGHFSLLHEGRTHVLVQRIAQGAGLLGAVENGDPGGSGRNDRQQVLGGEGAVQAHLDQAD